MSEQPNSSALPLKQARQYADYLRGRNGRGVDHLGEKIIILDDEIERLTLNLGAAVRVADGYASALADRVSRERLLVRPGDRVTARKGLEARSPVPTSQPCVYCGYPTKRVAANGKPCCGYCSHLPGKEPL